MPLSRLVAVTGAAVLTAAALASSLPASAATGNPGSRPDIVTVGGSPVTYFNQQNGGLFRFGTASTADLSPSFVVHTTDTSAGQGVLTIHPKGGGRAICTSGEPKRTTDGGFDYTCTPSTPLGLGAIKVEAVITGAGGAAARPSSPVTVGVQGEAPTVEFDGYDPEARSVSAFGTGHPGAHITVLLTNGSSFTAEVQADGSWSTRLSGIAPTQSMTIDSSVAGATTRITAVFHAA